MSLLCRAKRKCPPAIAALSAEAVAEKAGQGNKTDRVRGFHCPDNDSPDRIPSDPLENNPKYGVKGDPKISDNRKYFGNISEKQPFSEKISDYFFWRRMFRVRVGQSGPARRSPESLRGEGGSNRCQGSTESHPTGNYYATTSQ
jgi:hypothetical protein